MYTQRSSFLAAGSFYSDSDTDSDNDKRRIHVKIKPLDNGQTPISASVDELRATVENISLSPTGVFAVSLCFVDGEFRLLQLQFKYQI